MAKKQQTDYAAELQKCHDRWQQIFEHGSNDPGWSDGCNLNLVHNHCHYYRRLIEENYAPEDYPAIYFKEIPPEVDMKYMARSDEIRAAAKASLARYKADLNYRYIRSHRDDFSPKTLKKLSVDNVLGYASGLENAIARDDLVTMRRHERAESYLESFESCVQRMREAPPEEVQLSLFSLSAGGVGDLDYGDDDEDFDEDEGAEFGGAAMAY
jgi:hypothetical protein